MKFVINDVSYDIIAAIQKSTLNQLKMLKANTRTDELPGVSIKDIKTQINEMGAVKDPLDIFDTDEAIHVFRGMIYLARICAGENVTVDEANDFPIFELGFENDDEVKADPKAPTDSAPDDVREAPPTTTP